MRTYEISSLFDTRWACRYMTVRAIKASYDPLKQVLNQIAERNSKQRFQAQGLLKAINSIEFCVATEIFTKILSLIYVTHKYLQATGCTLAKGIKILKV